MSCKALEYISELEKCQNICIGNYCETHKYKYRLEKPDECPICMDVISETTEIPLECGHWFHKECLKPTNLHICPMCRYSINDKEVEYIFGKNHVEENVYGEIDVIEVQELEPVNNERFIHNLHNIFDSEYDETNIDIEIINIESLERLTDRDNTRFNFFMEKFINMYIDKSVVPMIDRFWNTDSKTKEKRHYFNINRNIIYNIINQELIKEENIQQMYCNFNIVNYDVEIGLSSVHFSDILGLIYTRRDYLIPNF